MIATHSLRTQHGLELQIRAIEIVETYKEEFLVGEPDLLDNIRVYNGINCPDNWRVERCVIRQADFNVNQPKYDPYTVAVWLRSNQSVNDPNGQYDFSELVLVFTIESIIDFSVQHALQSKLKNFNWQDFALNGQY
jgi:hypothetical protein